MHRILFQLGPITVYTYGAMMVIAFLVATRCMEQDAKRLPPKLVALQPSQVIDWACLVMLGGVAGARALYVAQFWPFYREHFLESFAIWHGGLIWYGGFLGGAIVVAIYLRIVRVSFLRAADQGFPYITLAHAIGRVGCFLNGCCYGTPTDAWYGVWVPDQPGPVIPVQLIEAGFLLLLFVFLRQWQRTAVMNRPGRLFSLYLVAYGVIRFGVEFLRGGQRHHWLGLSAAQLMSVGLVVAGLLLLLIVSMRPAPKPSVSARRVSS